MASYLDLSQFDEAGSTKPAPCAVCEAMLPDAVDGTLSEAEQRAFDKHVAGCVTCSQELAEAQRGAAWLAMLKGHAPEPPAALLQRILAETTGAVVAQAAVAAPLTLDETAGEWATPAFVPARKNGGFAAGWRRIAAAFSFEGASMAFQPRLAMTAAMAFFSIALTMNMAGVRLSDVEHGMTQPASLRRTVADAGASAKRSFQNLRVVYAVESRVSDLRHSDGFEDRFDDQGTPGALDHSHVATPDAGTDQGTGQGNTAPGQAPEENKKQEKAVPQGSSELQLPAGSTNAPARKGV